MSFWHFGPPGAEVLVRNAEALMAHLAVHLGGWPVRYAGPDAPRAPDIDIVAPADDDIAIAAPALGAAPIRFADPVAAARGLAEALVAAFAAASGRAALHAAAVETPRGLLCLVGPPRSGRTLLALQLAVLGQRLFADSRVAVRAGAAGQPLGFCLGLTPRLAMPLPADAGPALREFVDGYLEIQDAEGAYLKLWSGEAAGFGDEAPIAGLVLLDRAAGAAPSLEPADPAAAMTHLGAGADALVGGLPCRRLRYDAAADAVKLVYADLVATRR